MNTRHTITIDQEVYQRFKKKGHFGESYSLPSLGFESSAIPMLR
jgi:hypothetical protein